MTGGLSPLHLEKSGDRVAGVGRPRPNLGLGQSRGPHWQGTACECEGLNQAPAPTGGSGWSGQGVRPARAGFRRSVACSQARANPGRRRRGQPAGRRGPRRLESRMERDAASPPALAAEGRPPGLVWRARRPRHLHDRSGPAAVLRPACISTVGVLPDLRLADERRGPAPGQSPPEMGLRIARRHRGMGPSNVLRRLPGRGRTHSDTLVTQHSVSLTLTGGRAASELSEGPT